MNDNIVIGIEGEVASGKTSICKELTKLIPNSIFIDGGNIYRGIIEAIIKSGINIDKITDSSTEIDPLELMKKLKVDFKIENNMTEIYINGNKIKDDEIQSVQNSVGVSKVAENVNNEHLYKFARNIIESYKTHFNIIVSARDLVAIYPNMDYHIFVTASLEERIKRRYNQYNGKYSIDEIRNMIIARDKMHQDAGFNKTCDRTIKVDVTECKSAEESAKKIIDIINKIK